MTLIPRKPEQLTIVVKNGLVILDYGKHIKSRLVFTANGLEIYQKGASSDLHEDCIPNLAMQACIERKIPVLTLRRAK
jgi:hypothetical protein